MPNSPERAQLIQAYMLLHSQQTHVRRRLSQDLSPSPTSSTPTSSLSTPPSQMQKVSSPPSRRSSRSSSFSSTRTSSSSSPSSRRSSITPIQELPEEDHMDAGLSNDEMKLADICSKIKTTLTDLLNCDGVRGDSRMRNWVATRLMDVEHDLKESKRRRHSGDIERADVIAASLRE